MGRSKLGDLILRKLSMVWKLKLNLISFKIILNCDVQLKTRKLRFQAKRCQINIILIKDRLFLLSIRAKQLKI